MAYPHRTLSSTIFRVMTHFIPNLKLVSVDILEGMRVFEYELYWGYLKVSLGITGKVDVTCSRCDKSL